jgi:hypothetical protein
MSFFEVEGAASALLGQLGFIAIDYNIGLDHRVDLVVRLVGPRQQDVERGFICFTELFLEEIADGSERASGRLLMPPRGGVAYRPDLALDEVPALRIGPGRIVPIGETLLGGQCRISHSSPASKYSRYERGMARRSRRPAKFAPVSG